MKKAAPFLKKTFSNNAFKLIVGALLLTSAITSCTKKTVDVALATNSEEIATARGGNPNTLPTVSLWVTVSDAYNISSDGGGDYKNGSQNVQAIFDQSGTFAFNTFSSAKPKTIATRWVNYSFNNPVDPSNTYRPSPSNSKNFHFSTGGSSFGTNPFIPLQNLGVNGNPTTECIYMGNGIYNSTTGWRVSFHKGYEDVSNSPTSFAVVTRTSVTPAIWTITPVGSCTSSSNVAALRSEDGTVLYGYYYIPFFFTLKAQ